MKRLVLAWVTALLLTGGARAEVRLLSDGPDGQGVRVQATSSGPWAPVGSVDETVLNP